MQQMFYATPALAAIPALVTTAVTSSTNFSGIFTSSPNIARIEAKNFRFTFSVASLKLSRTALEEIFTNLPTAASSQTITVSFNYGVDTATTKFVTTTAQSKTIPMASTAGMVVGQNVSGTGTGITSGQTATSSVTLDTLTRVAHGLPNDTRLSFSNIGLTTGVSLYTIYFVVNATADTFQIALTAGGAAINLTGSNSTMTILYPSYITAITTNVSVTLDTPTVSSGSSRTLSFRLLNWPTAALKRWSVTF